MLPVTPTALSPFHPRKDFISIAFCLSCTSTLPFRVWMPVWCTIAVLSSTVVIPKYLQLCCTCISCYIFVSSNSRGLFLASTGNSLSVTVLAVLSEATSSEVPSAFEIFVNLSLTLDGACCLLWVEAQGLHWFLLPVAFIFFSPVWRILWTMFLPRRSLHCLLYTIL